MRGSVPHLHVSSGFSARYGASHPRDLVARAAVRGIGTVALTDRDMVTGTVRFAKAAAAAGVKPLFGVDLGIAPHAPQAQVRHRTPVRGGAHVAEAPFRATFLARNAGGWARLCRMMSAAHAEAGTPPTASWEMLAQYADEGLTVLLGPASEPLRALAAGRPHIAERLLAPWQQAVGSGLRLEIVCWGRSGTGPGSVRLAAHTLRLADHLGIPAVLTNAVRYADPVQHKVADVLDAARLLRPIARRRLDCGERWLKDGPAMTDIAERVAAAAGTDRSRAVRLIADTIAVADVCEVDPVRDLGLGVPHFPEPTTRTRSPPSCAPNRPPPCRASDPRPPAPSPATASLLSATSPTLTSPPFSASSESRPPVKHTTGPTESTSAPSSRARPPSPWAPVTVSTATSLIPSSTTGRRSASSRNSAPGYAPPVRSPRH